MAVAFAQPEDDVLEQDFSCHCCAQIMIDPTMLTCGHNFCRHCLAQWWSFSHKNQCPLCEVKWDGFPEINIKMRDAAEDLFGNVMQLRREAIHADDRNVHALSDLERYGDDLRRAHLWSFVFKVFLVFTAVATMVFVNLWRSELLELHNPLITEDVSDWTPEDVMSWLEDLGSWTQSYRDAFQQENVSGRLLQRLTEEELLKFPYEMVNQVHREAILTALDSLKARRFKPPQNLWEYRDSTIGKDLFLLLALTEQPRIPILYAYIFDYKETFLPFLHTCCPAVPLIELTEEKRYLDLRSEPSWSQWVHFLVQAFLIPYNLITDFAAEWLDVHYWPCWFILANGGLMVFQEVFAVVTLWKEDRLRSLPGKLRAFWWRMLTWGPVLFIIWPWIPRFVFNSMFYWVLCVHPFVSLVTLVRMTFELLEQFF